MTDIILQSIVDLAHHGKLPDVPALASRSKWRYSYIHGDAIIHIVHQHCPQNRPPGAHVPTADVPTTLPKFRLCKTCLSPFHFGEQLTIVFEEARLH